MTDEELERCSDHMQTFDSLLRTDMSVIDVDPTITSTRVPRGLGLALIRGPVRYVQLVPLDPTFPDVVLLGDRHVFGYCSETCDDIRCVTAQKSVPESTRTLMHYLNDTFGDLQPDVFLEMWVGQDIRKSSSPELDVHWYSTNHEPSPLTETIRSVLPCFHPSHTITTQGRRTTTHEVCPFRNLRVHGIDVRRMWRHERHQGDMVLRLLSTNPLHAGSLLTDAFPGYPLEVVITSALNRSPLKYFEDAFQLEHSRVSHELKRLPDTIRRELYSVLKTEQSHFEFYIPGSLTDEIMMLLHEGVRMSTNAKNILVSLWTVADFAAVDLYMVARALKTRSDGTRSQLSVVYAGDYHVLHICRLLSAMYIPCLHVEDNKYDEGLSDKCIILDPTVPLRPAARRHHALLEGATRRRRRSRASAGTRTRRRTRSARHRTRRRRA